MLENAGAVVVSPRERDWQKQEVIVDNDNPRANGKATYQEVNNKKKWGMPIRCRELRQNGELLLVQASHFIKVHTQTAKIHS